MHTLTSKGKAFAEDIAKRFHLVTASALHMLLAVRRGGGSMAQFNCLELGSGQWMRGGMTMAGDMFDHALKAKVNALCSELSAALAKGGLFEALPEDRDPAETWWPPGLGSPSSSGGQNSLRYAIFPATRRLAIERAGKVTVYDTGDHVIRGVSQQQGSDRSLSFRSQHGTIASSSLPVLSDLPGSAAESRRFAPGPKPSKQPSRLQAPGTSEITGLLAKLGQLRQNGILTDEEFTTKKRELLARL